MRRAVCLLSGGLDSATCLYWALERRDDVTALTLQYGQLHAREIDAARHLASALGIRHFVIPMALPWGGSALLDPSIPLPIGRDENQMSREIPPTYVPARNSIFLSFAASLAEARGAEAILIGANVLDYSGYPDCRPEYLAAFAEMIAKGTKAGQEGRRIEILAPLLSLGKKEIVLLARRLGVPFEKTWSCYQGREFPCGQCDACILRAKGFHEAGMEDPLISKVFS